MVLDTEEIQLLFKHIFTIHARGGSGELIMTTAFLAYSGDIPAPTQKLLFSSLFCSVFFQIHSIYMECTIFPKLENNQAFLKKKNQEQLVTKFYPIYILQNRCHDNFIFILKK